jgi:hypothetical protein
MTWSLTAGGHTPEPWSDDPEVRTAAEQALFDDLQAVLSKPEHGATSSSFSGNFVGGNPHAKPEESEHTREDAAAEASQDDDGKERPGDDPGYVS